jgi:hypothetical protein
MHPESQMEQAAQDREDRYEGIFCIGCCAPSERWWFRWGLPAQPVIALLLYLYYHVDWS